MKEHKGLVLSGVLAVLLIGWLGFLVHSAPRFAGSGLGAVFGIVGAILLVVPLALPVVKRIPFLHERVTRHVSQQALLTVHVYAGILGPVFALVHTGHKLDSWLGMTLTATVLLVVVSGYAVQVLMPWVRHEIKDKLLLLQTARGDLDSAWGLVERAPAEQQQRPVARVFWAGLASIGFATSNAGLAADVIRLAGSVADLEYAVRTHEGFKRWFGRALKLHIALSVVLYVLLALHIGAGIYFGLRWLP